MTSPLLELRGIRKDFAGVQALRGVDFSLQAGEVHALLGENGAGKSTLIKVVTGAVQPDAGEIHLQGSPAGHITPATAHRLGVACIYQQPALFPELTVAENIALRLESTTAWRRLNWRARQQRAEELLQRLGAKILPQSLIRGLSMPEQQLVEIACALGTGARVVIMDEPTASLTQQEQELLFEVIAELRTSGAGIIYISHRLEEIFQVADRVTVLRDGESVGSHPIGDVDHDRLIQLMVGREVTQIYPPSRSTPGPAILDLENVSCRDSGLENLNLQILSGEVLGLAGLVGAGRTELARMLFGLTPPTAGRVRHASAGEVGLHSPQEALSLGIAYVPEDRRRHGVVLDLPIAHNLTMAIHSRIFPGTWLRLGAERNLALDFIRQLAIRTDGPDAAAGSLSGGNQQKVALARWLAAQPRLLILDEPTQGVDVGAKSEIHRIIRDLTAEGLAVLLISSDLPEIIGMSDRIVVMREGRLVAELPGGASPDAVMAAALGQTPEGNRA